MLNLEDHINRIVAEFSYKTRKQKFPDACICYLQDKPCHDMENLNCFLCYCPFYDRSKEEGGCLKNSKDGEWFYSKKLYAGKVWDCSNCTITHEDTFVFDFLEKSMNLSQKQIK